LDIGWIKQQIRSGNYEVSGHAEDERQAERISIADVEAALLSAEMLEDYPNDPRGPSCLVLGYGIPGYPIHVVCGQTPFEESQAYYGLYSIPTQMG
jgi:Domain of unknown function (DUF4258)